jgi:hypothetical protein
MDPVLAGCIRETIDDRTRDIDRAVPIAAKEVASRGAALSDDCTER